MPDLGEVVVGHDFGQLLFGISALSAGRSEDGGEVWFLLPFAQCICAYSEAFGGLFDWNVWCVAHV